MGLKVRAEAVQTQTATFGRLTSGLLAMHVRRLDGV
jgi:hypothetical protein